MSNYVPYHIHDMTSNAVTNIDSVTAYTDYIARAKELGMSVLGFANHGGVFGWYSKKQAIENAGMKYLHAVEIYLTESLTAKIRDNYHMVLIAKNFDGFLELNRLISSSFNREDGHYYYAPRITFTELFATSDNIIITSACIGSVFGRGPRELQAKTMEFMMFHADRCFLEIQHHNVQEQKDYNLLMVKYSNAYKIPLIAGTDSHSLNALHADGRVMLQRAKKVFFDNEDGWDLTFKSYDELVAAYENQGVLDSWVYLEAIENTNHMAGMVDNFGIDRSNKYPKICDNPESEFLQMVELSKNSNVIIQQRHSTKLINETIRNECDAYIKTGAHNFILLSKRLIDYEKSANIRRGPGRGSVNGSLLAYIMGITRMDSLKFNLNFFRFINPSRITLADVDTDYSEADRQMVKTYLLRDKMNLPHLQTSEIVMFGKIKLKGAIKDIGRALDMDVDITKEISSNVRKAKEDDWLEDEEDDEDENVEYVIDQKWRDKYPELFYYVDIVQGTIVSVGSHPSGVLVTDWDINSNIGIFTKSNTDYPVCMLDKYEIESLNYVKLDILGLINIDLINKTCDLAGIDLITPDNINLEDEDVWMEISKNTAGIFQWDKPMGRQYMSKFFSEKTLERAKSLKTDFSYLKWFSFANGVLRPGCTSFRDNVAEGMVYDNGMSEINDFFADTLGYCVMQESLMQFLVKFCNYTPAESDGVRRKIAKSMDTSEFLPEIEKRFVKNVTANYGVDKTEAKRIIDKFLIVVKDASSYMFSWNHSDAYSYIGYACGYLRHYYPLEFITTALNVFEGKEERTMSIMNYASKHGIKIMRPKFRYSRAQYYMDSNTKSIYKGLESIKTMSASVADEMQVFYKNKYTNFVDLLYDLSNTSINKRIEILIKIGFFSEFGNIAELWSIYEYYALYRSSKVIKKDGITDDVIRGIIARRARETDKQYRVEGEIRDILNEISQYIMSKDLDDLSLQTKIEYQMDALGYVDLSTGREEDITKLIIINLEAMKTKDKKKIWAYKLTTSSLGSGKQSEIMLNSRLYDQNKISKYDTIFIKREWLEKQVNGKFTNWYLKAYQKVTI